MLVRLRCHNTNDPDKVTWFESYDYPDLNAKVPKDQEEAVARAQRVLARYNETLRSNEHPRTLKGLKIMGPSLLHYWQKSNLVTIMRGHHSYDTGECVRCGVTGKRQGLSQTFVPDRIKEQKCAKGV